MTHIDDISIEKKLKVVVLGPPLNNSGGVGTLFKYARSNFSPGVDVQFIDTRGYWSNPVYSLFNVLIAIWLLTIAKSRSRVDLVHINLGASGSTFRKSALLIFAKKILRIPCVVQLHSSSFDTFFNKNHQVIKKFVVASLNQSDRILVLGQNWKTYLIEIGCNKQIVSSFQMGVPDLDERTTSNPDLPFIDKTECFQLLFAGEMGERKGLPNLLEALSAPRLRNIFLHVAGSGDLEYWKKIVTSFGIQNQIHFYGLLPSNDLLKIMQKVDGVILPSKAEGLPVSVLEGLSAGKIVICTKVGSLPEFLQDQVNCIFLPARTTEAIVSTLSTMLDITNAENMLSLKKNARELWRTNFDASKTTEGLVQIWRHVLLDRDKDR
jgi:glycosyltransferase involved in cell wall biosynthesis